jgi:hypothetical protein
VTTGAGRYLYGTGKRPKAHVNPQAIGCSGRRGDPHHRVRVGDAAFAPNHLAAGDDHGGGAVCAEVDKPFQK